MASCTTRRQPPARKPKATPKAKAKPKAAPKARKPKAKAPARPAPASRAPTNPRMPGSSHVAYVNRLADALLKSSYVVKTPKIAVATVPGNAAKKR